MICMVRSFGAPVIEPNGPVAGGCCWPMNASPRTHSPGCGTRSSTPASPASRSCTPTPSKKSSAGSLPPGADREVISHRLWRFYSQAAASESPEVHRLAETIEAWWPAVLASITTGYTNARSEGYNRLAKHVGRDAFGFRNPTNQRRRIRWACTRQHRRASAQGKADLPG